MRRSRKRHDSCRLCVCWLVSSSLVSGVQSADFVFGELVNLKSVIPELDPTTDTIDCLSSDGLEMYIASTRAGGQGDCDLWVLKRSLEGWGLGSPGESWACRQQSTGRLVLHPFPPTDLRFTSAQTGPVRSVVPTNIHDNTSDKERPLGPGCEYGSER